MQQEIVAEIEGYQKVIDGARAVVENYRPHIHIDPDWPMVVKIARAIFLALPEDLGCQYNRRMSDERAFESGLGRRFNGFQEVMEFRGR